jgi:branched-chain amino acid transport system ATP-binding protein
MNFSVPAGEVVTLLGRNGAGKTTTMRAIMGMLSKRTGSVRFEGTETIDMLSNLIARTGIAYCPEERGIFSSLNVRENLELPPVVKPGGLTLDEIYQLFPRLLERTNSQGTKLSGGEQKMLAIARILRTGARFLLLDEPTSGLDPVADQKFAEFLTAVKGKITVIFVSHKPAHIRLADTLMVFENGYLRATGAPNDLLKPPPAGNGSRS